jgi:hypothetical protein
MHKLSVSRAWDETKAIVARDGRLLTSVALALIAFPTAVSGLLNPRGMTNSAPLWVDVVTFVVSLIAIAGQLALIRLALGPSVTVGGAIEHGFRRMPIYFVTAVLILLGLLLLALPFVALLALLGIKMTSATDSLSPGAALISLLYMTTALLLGFRMVMAAPVASSERVGPIGIIKRTWSLTRGHWWQLFGFVVMFFVGAVVLLIAVNTAVGLLVAVLLGPIEPMSASALVTALVQALLNAVITTLFAVMLARMYVQLAGRDDAQASVPSSGT